MGVNAFGAQAVGRALKAEGAVPPYMRVPFRVPEWCALCPCARVLYRDAPQRAALNL